jgi:Mn2+/Fe2+ NRAMP family transporter
LAEVAIVCACDAEVLGMAYLLFGIPLIESMITVLDTFLLLFLINKRHPKNGGFYIGYGFLFLK